MKLPRLFQQLRRRWRTKRWPITRQIAFGFAALMMINGVLISAALEVWGMYLFEEATASLSPGVQQTLQQIEAGNYELSAEELAAFTREFAPIQEQLNGDIDTAMYLLIALAGFVTLAFGYVLLGRIGRGLGNIAMAAQRITEGDLTARALPASFRSREEDELTRDFNLMAASLQRANRELAENTASIAHELRTPLTILRGRLHGITDGVFALEPREVEGLLYQVEGLSRLVDDLQTVSLSYSDRLAITCEPTDLALEVRRVLASMAPDLTNAGLEPVLALAAAPLDADGARVRQVIAAVLSNACRYAALSGELAISTRVDASDAVLEIEDNGPGIIEVERERAFDRFWRGEKSRNRNSGGSGLGLSVVRAIAEAHNGTATLENGERSGTRFILRLPQGGK
jgi:two-component system, OmpR family, sensor histidine kinase AdeS